MSVGIVSILWGRLICIRIQLKKKISLKKGVITAFIFALIFCFAQSAIFFDTENARQDLIYEPCSHDAFFEEIPMDFGYSFSAKKIKQFKQGVQRVSAKIWHNTYHLLPKIVLASWNWPQHGEYKFLFRFTPF